MNNLKEIYSSNDKKAAACEAVKALTVYIAIAAVFVALVVTFLIIFIKFELNVFLCAIPNIIFTIAFVWFSVLFFASFYPDRIAVRNFFRSFDNAQKTSMRAVYEGETGKVTASRVKFKEHRVRSADGETELYVLTKKDIKFIVGKTYDFSVIGTRIVAFAEADDD